MSQCDKCQALCKQGLEDGAFCIGFTDILGNVGIDAYRDHSRPLR